MSARKPLLHERDCQRFDTWSEWIDHVSKQPVIDRTTGIDGASFKTDSAHDYRWSGTSSYEEALTLGKEGWQGGVDKASKIAKPLFNKVSVRIERKVPVYDVEGIQLDMGAYLRNEPEPFVRYQEEITEGTGVRLIRIAYANVASAGISRNVLEAKGATMAALVELLEFAGHRVELIDIPFSLAASRDYTRKCGWYVSVKIKEFHQPLDMSRIMFALGHPSNMRRLGFRALELASYECRQWAGLGYGMPADPPVDEEFGKVDIFVGSAMLGEPQWTDEATTERWIIEQLEAQGIKLGKEVV